MGKIKNIYELDRNASRIFWTEDQRGYIEEEYLKGRTMSAISRDFKVGSGSIKKILVDLGVWLHNNQKSLTTSQEKQICDLYFKSDILVSGICNAYGISSPTFQKTIKAQGFELNGVGRGNRKYTLNENYFDNIQTEEQAYWLGFLYADGYTNTPRGRVRLGLKKSDEEHLEKFKVALGCDSPVKYSKKEMGDRTYYTAFVEVCSRHLCNTLEDLGCGHRKGDKLKYPCSEILPTELTIPFIRGYFDGDGSVSTAGVYKPTDYQRYKMSFAGTPSMLVGIRKALDIEHLALEERGSHSVLGVCGNKQVSEKLRRLYEDSSVHLDRKHKLSPGVIKYYKNYKNNQVV